MKHLLPAVVKRPMNMTDIQKPERRWFHPRPAWLVAGLLGVEGMLWLSERFLWSGLHGHKGYAVLACVAVVGMSMLLMLLWFAAALLFRLRFQFSLRSLFVLVVVVALSCSWLAVRMKEAREQKEAVAGIEAAGGVAAYDWQVDAAGELVPNAQRVGSGRLRKLLGDDFFANVATVIINVPMEARDPPPNTRFGVEYLDKLPNLQRLKIFLLKMTEDDARQLRRLSHLRELNLSYVNITDAGLKEIGELTQLQKLRLLCTDVSNSGLAHLRKLSRLQSLQLYAASITDHDLACLEGMTDLRDLDLGSANITDAGLLHLHGLTKLQSLKVTFTGISKEGVKNLQQVLPNCKVQNQPPF